MNKTKLASHNTWTYLPVKKWWMKLFNWIAKCQDYSIERQIEEKVHCVDLRVRFDDWGTPYFCHGLISYKGDVRRELSYLSFIAETKGIDIYCRVMLEDTKYTKDRERQQEIYKLFCKELETSISFKNIHFWGGWCKYNWRADWIYKFKTKEPSIKEIYSSVAGHRIDDVYPRYFAKRNNKTIRTKEFDTDYLMIDFINYGETLDKE